MNLTSEFYSLLFKGYMRINCAPACMSCDELDFNKRCPVDENAKNAFEPGDVNKFFERVTTDEEFAKYNITIHSRPRRLDDDESVKDGPWLITFENGYSSKSCGLHF